MWYGTRSSLISHPLSFFFPKVFGDNHLVQLISLQKADGSWDLNEGLAMVLGMSLEDILAALPIQVRFREETGVCIFERLGP